jgi:YVTN family beta-propeller protein
MAKFTLNTPITTDTATISIDGGLPIGTHRFHLVAVDEAGNHSQPAIADIAVTPPNPATFTVKITQPVALHHDPVANEIWVVAPAATTPPAGLVSVVSVTQKAVVATIASGPGPAEIAVGGTASRRIALVTNSSDGTVTGIDMVKRAVLSTIKVGGQPLGVDITPDGQSGYVVIPGVSGASAATAPGSLNVIDLNTLVVTARVPLGISPTRVVFALSGKEAYVNNTGDGTVTVITVATHTVAAVVKVGGTAQSAPQQVAASQSDYPLWIANSGTSTASIVAANHSVADQKAGIAAQAIAIRSNGDLALAAGPNDKNLAVLDSAGAAPRLLPLPAAGGPPGTVAMAPGNRLALVAHPAANAISLIDAQGISLLNTLNTPNNPIRVIVTADAKLACVACSTGGALLGIDLTGLA